MLNYFKQIFTERKRNMRDVYFTDAVQNSGLIHQVFVRWKKGLLIQQESFCSLGRILHSHTHKHTHTYTNTHAHMHTKAVNFWLISYRGCKYPYNKWRSVKHSMLKFFFPDNKETLGRNQRLARKWKGKWCSSSSISTWDELPFAEASFMTFRILQTHTNMQTKSVCWI